MISHSLGSYVRGSRNEDIDPALRLSPNIPSLQDTIEMAHLSVLVYGFISNHATNCTSFTDIYDAYITSHPQYSTFLEGSYFCHLYERDEQDTQVMIVSKTPPKDSMQKGYIAIVYAGTDDFRTALTDADVLTTVFGPEINGTHPLVPEENIRVHKGFNNAVFRNDLFDRIKDKIHEIRREQNGMPMRILTTGHSLGGADAVLTAVALKLQPDWKDELIESISFGCPKTGNWAWRDFVNSIDKLGIWRVVNGLDIVPRLPPGIRFHHVGHTLQLDGDRAKAYWLHDGDKGLGYRGIPFGWNTLPYILAPAAAVEHIVTHYTKYLDQKSTSDINTYYFNDFEKVDGRTDDQVDDEIPNDDDIWSNPPDEEEMTLSQYEHDFAEIIAMEYLYVSKHDRREMFSLSSEVGTEMF
jgi:hypothetical protein